MALHCYIFPQLWSNVQFSVRSSTLINDSFLQLSSKKSSFSLFDFNGRQKTPHNTQGWAAASCSKTQHCLQTETCIKANELVLLHLVLTQKNCTKCKPEAKSSGAAPSTTHTNSSSPKEFDECCVDRSFQSETLPSWARSTTPLALLSNLHL